jgi:hypothetical protein
MCYCVSVSLKNKSLFLSFEGYLELFAVFFITPNFYVFIPLILAEPPTYSADPCLVNTALDFATGVHARFFETKILGLFMKICRSDTILPHADASKTVAKSIFKATFTHIHTHCYQVRNLTYQRHTAL